MIALCVLAAQFKESSSFGVLLSGLTSEACQCVNPASILAGDAKSATSAEIWEPCFLLASPIKIHEPISWNLPSFLAAYPHDLVNPSIRRNVRWGIARWCTLDSIVEPDRDRQ